MKDSKKIKVTVKTITPIWTGDAWGDNSDIRSSSLMGSLRFWFEVVCYFSGITTEEDYENGKLKAELKEKLSNKNLQNLFIENGANFEGIDKTLAEMKITLPARVFGCTGWKSWVRIKKIEPIGDHCFGNRLNLPKKICLLRRDQSIKIDNDCPNSSNDNWSVWYFKKTYFSGKFTVTFEIEDKIIKPIFYPLLTFMEKYGFWGGGWNIGHGRLRIKKVEEKENNTWQERNDWRKEKFELSTLFKDKITKHEDKKFCDFIQNASDFSELENKTKRVLYKLENQITEKDFSGIIKELIRTKAMGRKNHKDNIRNDELRHRLFGTTKYPPRKEELPQGTKIIPWIYEENNQLKGGFISIAGILNLRR